MMIAFDLDDVIIETGDKFHNEVLRLTGEKPSKDSFAFTVAGYTKKEMPELINTVVTNITPNCEPTDRAIEVLKKFHELFDKEIHIITARNPKLADVTTDWLDKYLGKNQIPYKVDFSGGTGKKKHQFLLPDTEYFVDDAPHNIIDLADHLTNVFIFNRPWNEEKTFPRNCVRVRSLAEVYNYLLLRLKYLKP